MNITGKGSEVFDAGNVLLIVENALVKVRDAPAQGNVVVKELRELGSSLTGVGVTPCAEGNENLLLFIKGHVTVHHSTETDSGQ